MKCFFRPLVHSYQTRERIGRVTGCVDEYIRWYFDRVCIRGCVSAIRHVKRYIYGVCLATLRDDRYVESANATLHSTWIDVDDGCGYCCCFEGDGDCHGGRSSRDNCCCDRLRDDYSDTPDSTDLDDPYRKHAPGPCLHAVAPRCSVNQPASIGVMGVPIEKMMERARRVEAFASPPCFEYCC